MQHRSQTRQIVFFKKRGKVTHLKIDAGTYKTSVFAGFDAFPMNVCRAFSKLELGGASGLLFLQLEGHLNAK